MLRNASKCSKRCCKHGEWGARAFTVAQVVKKRLGGKDNEPGWDKKKGARRVVAKK
jgi:hypothetical protein